MTQSPEVKQPKLQGYCAALYDRFFVESTIEILPGTSDEIRVWRGGLVATALDVGIPDGVYKRVTNQLENLYCIEQLERGVRGAPTTMLLLRAPTLDVWQDAENISARGLTSRAAPAILSRRVEDMERRTGKLDIPLALKELQDQIDELKFAVRDLQQKTNKES